MSLIRTRAGLANKHLFHGVDAMAYVEGGSKSYSHEQVMSGIYGVSSVDIPFWEGIFAVFKPNMKVKFCAVGSKSTILKIADQIIQFGIKTCYALMDRDSGNSRSDYSAKKNVFMTHGYSWENDVFQESVICNAIISLSGIGRATFNKYVVVCKHLKNFSLRMKPAVLFDHILSCCEKSFIPRNPTGSGMIDPKNVKVNSEVIKNKYREHKDEIISSLDKIDKSEIVACRDVYGHLYCHYCSNIIAVLVKDISRINVMKSMAINVSMNIFLQSLTQIPTSSVYLHYKVLFKYYDACI